MEASSSQQQNPSPGQIAALISILQLDLAELHRPARVLLTSFGDHSVPSLLKTAQSEHMATRTRSRAVLRDIQLGKLLQSFQRLDLGRVGRDSVRALFEGQMLSTQMVRTFVPSPDRLIGHLRSHANALRDECIGKGTPECVKLLAKCIHQKMGLQVVVREPLVSDHYMIHKVVGAGVGAQITLSLIYVMVARWAGLQAAVIKLPDQFLLRIGGARSILMNPMLDGQVITRGDCARASDVGSLRELSDREILVEHLRCLWDRVPPGAATMIQGVTEVLDDGPASTA